MEDKLRDFYVDHVRSHRFYLSKKFSLWKAPINNITRIILIVYS